MTVVRNVDIFIDASEAGVIKQAADRLEQLTLDMSDGVGVQAEEDDRLITALRKIIGVSVE